jgi:hypothetical protein
MNECMLGYLLSDKIAWGDADSITRASFHRTFKFGGRFDTKYLVHGASKTLFPSTSQVATLLYAFPFSVGHTQGPALVPQNPEVDAIFWALGNKTPYAGQQTHFWPQPRGRFGHN